MTRKRKPAAGGNGNGQRGEQVKFSLDLYHTKTPASCQLSPDSLTRIAYLVGDLGIFYLEQCSRLIDLPDFEFNEPFRRACLCLSIEDQLLRKAGEAIEGAANG